MAKMIVELSWDGEDLGPVWLNLSNLKLLLFTSAATRVDLLAVKELEHSELPDGSV